MWNEEEAAVGVQIATAGTKSYVGVAGKLRLSNDVRRGVGGRVRNCLLSFSKKWWWVVMRGSPSTAAVKFAHR